MIVKRSVPLFLTLSFLLAVNAYPQGNANRATLSFSATSGLRGSTDNKVSVKLRTPVGLGGGVYIVRYNPAILKVRTVEKSRNSNFKKVKHFIDEQNGSVLVTFLEVEGDAKVFNDEPIFEIGFEVATDARIGTTPLKFGNCVLADSNGDVLGNTRRDGNFDVKQ